MHIGIFFSLGQPWGFRVTSATSTNNLLNKWLEDFKPVAILNTMRREVIFNWYWLQTKLKKTANENKSLAECTSVKLSSFASIEQILEAYCEH